MTGFSRSPGILDRLSIRTQMLAAAVITLAPMLVLAVYQIHEETDHGRQNVERIAQTIANIN
ncbi:MAG: hypothetical protein WCJ64_08040, partial [Rhodospirillaceae bacterium]